MQDEVIFVSPGSFLASFFPDWSQAPVLALVTGESGAGKTAWCQEAARLAARRGLRVAGLLSPAVFENSLKVGIDLVELSSGERRRLAGRREPSSPEGRYNTQHWALRSETLAWGNQLLAQTGETDLFIIDELGPLEMERNAGLQAALAELDARRYRLACAVVRPSLLPVAKQRWPAAILVRPDDPHR